MSRHTTVPPLIGLVALASVCGCALFEGRIEALVAERDLANGSRITLFERATISLLRTDRRSLTLRLSERDDYQTHTTDISRHLRENEDFTLKIDTGHPRAWVVSSPSQIVVFIVDFAEDRDWQFGETQPHWARIE